jgi:hypothetical protein
MVENEALRSYLVAAVDSNEARVRGSGCTSGLRPASFNACLLQCDAATQATCDQMNDEYHGWSADYLICERCCHPPSLTLDPQAFSSLQQKPPTPYYATSEIIQLHVFAFKLNTSVCLFSDVLLATAAARKVSVDQRRSLLFSRLTWYIAAACKGLYPRDCAASA